jgi:hypothetical protein
MKLHFENQAFFFAVSHCLVPMLSSVTPAAGLLSLTGYILAINYILWGQPVFSSHYFW